MGFSTIRQGGGLQENTKKGKKRNTYFSHFRRIGKGGGLPKKTKTQKKEMKKAKKRQRK
jgi:hypothetical protein